MTTQPKDLMTLEDMEAELAAHIDAMTDAELEQKMREAGAKTMEEVQMQIPTMSLTLFSREETMERLNVWMCHVASSSSPVDKEMLDDVSTFHSAIHHLEAGRKECQCEAFQDAQDLRLRDRVGRFGNSWYVSLGLPPLAFCPWCGGKVPTTQEVKENICPGCGKPSNHMEAGTTSDHWGVWHSECEKEFWMAGTGLDDRVPPFSKRNVEVKEEPC